MIAGAGVALGCSSGPDCTLVSCAGGLNVTLEGVAMKYASNLPLMIAVRVSGSSSSFQINHTGAAPTCSDLGTTNQLCSIDGQGSVVLTALPFAGVADGASVSVDTTVSDATGTVFSGMKTATVTASADGCGTLCDAATVVFTP
jgi:hypothetical protein